VLSALSMAWFFSANTVALDGLNGLPDNVKTIVNDTQLFIDTTKSELIYVTDNNFEEFTDNIDTNIDEISTNLNDTITHVIEEIHFQKLLDISNHITDLAIDFHDVKLGEWKTVLLGLINQVQDISTLLASFKSEAVTYCESNPLPICTSISSLPNVDTEILPKPNTLDGFQLDDNIMNAIQDFKNAIDQAEQDINNFSSDFTDDKINEIKTTIDDLKEDISEQIQDFIKQIDNFSVQEMYDKDLEQYLLDAQDYFDYVYYVVLGFGLFLVAILALYLIGILLGSFGSVGGPAKRQGR
jgi:gas vesicle protein